jgi:hypothetical protein
MFVIILGHIERIVPTVYKIEARGKIRSNCIYIVLCWLDQILFLATFGNKLQLKMICNFEESPTQSRCSFHPWTSAPRREGVQLKEHLIPSTVSPTWTVRSQNLVIFKLSGRRLMRVIPRVPDKFTTRSRHVHDSWRERVATVVNKSWTCRGQNWSWSTGCDFLSWTCLELVVNEL